MPDAAGYVQWKQVHFVPFIAHGLRASITSGDALSCLEHENEGALNRQRGPSEHRAKPTLAIDRDSFGL